MRTHRSSSFVLIALALVSSGGAQARVGDRIRARRAGSPATVPQPVQRPQVQTQAEVRPIAPAPTPAAATPKPSVFAVSHELPVSKAPTPANRPAAKAKVDTVTTYVEGRFVAETFQYKDTGGKWKNPVSSMVAKKDGTFLNANDEPVDYKQGDILFRTSNFGWFMAKANSPQIEEVSETTVPNPHGVPLTPEQTYVIHYSNLYRMKHGLAPMVVAPTLVNMSQKKSDTMATLRSFSHDSGPIARNAAENIGWNYANAKAAVDGWYSSKKGHREALLSPLNKYIGAGVATSNLNQPYWTQQFWADWAVPAAEKVPPVRVAGSGASKANVP